MPDNVVGKANDLVSSSLGHTSESFGLCLVLKGVRREIDPCKGTLEGWLKEGLPGGGNT